MTSYCKSNFVRANGIDLHSLDWGGEGPVLLFIAGMGCSAYIFSRLAPRFTDTFHVLAFDRRGHGDSEYPETGYDPDTLTEDLRQFIDALQIERVILAGHSLAYIELTHFAVLYPERVLKLVYLDAAYDSTSAEYKVVMEKNPLPPMMPVWPAEDPETVEEYFATLKRLYPALAVIWDEVMDEQSRHTLRITPEGKVVDKMSEVIAKALNDTIASYVPEYQKISVPVLSIFAMRGGSEYLSSEYMTEEQWAQVMDFFTTVLQPHQKRDIEHFRRKVPHAKVVIIPEGHHYCFMDKEELVYGEMRVFLLEE